MDGEVFINNIWHQNCGDSLKILRKVDKKLGKHYLYECEFIKYPCKILAKIMISSHAVGGCQHNWRC